MTDRVIGRYSGIKDGPLLIVFGGLHGNEPAGIKAIELMFKMLEVEPITNPDFQYAGSFLGIIGNLQAYQKGERFIDRDLNRMWTDDNVHRIMNTPYNILVNEDKELYEINELIRMEIDRLKPQKIIVLDLHTTSSFGGIFSIPTDAEESTKIAIELHAPVVKGMLNGISGTTLHYFNTRNLGIPTVAVAFESGQHDEEISMNRAIAAITNCMKIIGSIEAAHVENRHDAILIEYSKNLPKVTELIYKHSVAAGDNFRMLPNYKNFQPIRKGEILAVNEDGEIKAPEDALILMPLYQKQGDDGFFLIKELEGYI